MNFHSVKDLLENREYQAEKENTFCSVIFEQLVSYSASNVHNTSIIENDFTLDYEQFLNEKQEHKATCLSGINYNKIQHFVDILSVVEDNKRMLRFFLVTDITTDEDVMIVYFFDHLNEKQELGCIDSSLIDVQSICISVENLWSFGLMLSLHNFLIHGKLEMTYSELSKCLH